jgi:hypothetical protein
VLTIAYLFKFRRAPGPVPAPQIKRT